MWQCLEKNILHHLFATVRWTQDIFTSLLPLEKKCCCKSITACCLSFSSRVQPCFNNRHVVLYKRSVVFILLCSYRCALSIYSTCTIPLAPSSVRAGLRCAVASPERQLKWFQKNSCPAGCVNGGSTLPSSYNSSTFPGYWQQDSKQRANGTHAKGSGVHMQDFFGGISDPLRLILRIFSAGSLFAFSPLI